MPRDTKRRQKALQRKAAKRKRKKKAQATKSRLSPPHPLRAAAAWPLYECLVTQDWHEVGQIVQILVARRSPWGEIAAGVFLVDLGCLGVKSAFARFLGSVREYERLREMLQQEQRMVPADLNLVAKIIREGIAYAKQLGFAPDPDYRQAAILLRDADPEACDVEIPLGGEDGKPFYISGPYDDVPRIMAQLKKAVGPDGFLYLVHLSGPEDLLDLD